MKTISNLKIFLVIIFCICAKFQLDTYPGMVSIFLLFTASFLLLVTSVMYINNSYFYSFSAALLFLGFWIKFFWHSFSGLAYVEPAGSFDYSVGQWNEVLQVTSIGVLSFIASGFLFKTLTKNIKPIKWDALSNNFATENWGKFAFIFSAGVLLLVFLNLYYGICVIGFTPKTILIWPLNALITLMILGGGLACCTSIIGWFLVQIKLDVFKIYIAILLVGLILNISCLSRGLILTLVIPIFYSSYINRSMLTGMTKLKVVLISFLFGLVLMTSFSVVNHLRDRYYYYPQKSEVEVSSDFSSDLSEFTVSSQVQMFLPLFHFAIDRWTGLEGVMAVVGYEKKSMNLIRLAIQDFPLKKPSIYETICPWPDSLTKSLVSGVRNFSIPGLLAFLYYSNSMVIVGLGVFLLVLIAMTFELVTERLIKNPFLTATISWILATNVIAFSGVPKFNLPLLYFLSIFVLLCYFSRLLISFMLKNFL